jgi:hypothetical protein
VPFPEGETDAVLNGRVSGRRPFVAQGTIKIRCLQNTNSKSRNLRFRKRKKNLSISTQTFDDTTIGICNSRGLYVENA